MLPVSQFTLSCFDFAGDCLRPGVDPSAGFGRSGFPLILEGVLVEIFWIAPVGLMGERREGVDDRALEESRGVWAGLGADLSDELDERELVLLRLLPP